jgi:hypothetical protein
LAHHTVWGDEFNIRVEGFWPNFPTVEFKLLDFSDSQSILVFPDYIANRSQVERIASDLNLKVILSGAKHEYYVWINHRDDATILSVLGGVKINGDL